MFEVDGQRLPTVGAGMHGYGTAFEEASEAPLRPGRVRVAGNPGQRLNAGGADEENGDVTELR